MFAGFGGQGILSGGKVLAHAAMEAGQQVAWIPSYGPEMRGGTAYCMVVVSDRPIGSPIIRNPSHLIAMNRPSLEKFAPMVKPGGIVVVNSSLISVESGRTDVQEVRVPAVELAQAAGSVRAANMVALAAFVTSSRLVDFDLLRRCVEMEFASKPKVLPINMDALERGRAAAAQPA
jgi:2-oxoglutarate ferredoxin oxidoreductase subunit gamma